MPIDRLVIYQLRTGLARGDHFASFVALAAFTDGTSRVGESTPPCPEMTERAVAEYSLLSRHGLLKTFLDRNTSEPYITAPILTCLDPTLARPADGQVSLCPLLDWDHPGEIAPRAHGLASQGCKVVKVNIPPNLPDAKVILHETRRAGEQFGLRFRYDAHEGLDLESAQTMVRWLDHPTTELLEQPLRANAWLRMASLYADSPIPLLLDESIITGSDVFLAAACADFIKLKLAKNGSPSRLLELIRQAREIGLKVILGSGRQHMIGCWLEGQVQVLAGLKYPGEMNGFHQVKPNFLADLFEATNTGFATDPKLSWSTVEHLLEQNCVREFQVPGVCSALSAPRRIGRAYSR